ncbi:hypothetical protein [Mesorhizobium sp. B2-5-9]|nr:hypothetical protein [Mesorhizobium sp. B2-5-9]
MDSFENAEGKLSEISLVADRLKELSASILGVDTVRGVVAEIWS